MLAAAVAASAKEGETPTCEAKLGGQVVCGDLVIGITLQQYEAGLKKRAEEILVELTERATRAEKDSLRGQIASAEAEKRVLEAESKGVADRLTNLQASYDGLVQRLAEANTALEAFAPLISKDAFEQAQAMLSRGDVLGAERKFIEIADTVRKIRKQADVVEARAIFEAGKLAEERIDWRAANAHYTRAARLQPSNWQYAQRAGTLARRLMVGDYPTPTVAAGPFDGDAIAKSQSPSRILDTGYERLREVGGEQKGYGLYSYVLIPAASQASAALLNEIFEVIPDIRSTGASPSQLNILYIPFRYGKDADFARAQATRSNLSIIYLDAFYDYQMARAILNNLCNPPAAKIVELCQSDLSRGPFIFTYAEPASKLAPIEPPYLLVDLREVHPRAFPEFVSAFQAQVKSEDVTGGARLHTLRLKILNMVLTAADWTTPVQKAVADIAHSVVSEAPVTRKNGAPSPGR
jgi:hypothetical protein